MAVWPILLPVPAAGQSVTSGTLTGVIREQGGRPLADALVTVSNQAAGGAYQVGSAADGSYQLPYLPPGPYQLFAEQIGYRPVLVRGLRIQPGIRLTVAVNLSEDSLPVTRVDTLWRSDPAFSLSPGAQFALPRSLMDRFPTSQRGFPTLAAFTSNADPDGGLSGLPGSETGFAMDGVQFEVARGRWAPMEPRVGPALALSGMDELSTLTAPLDVEWTGFGGGLLSGLTRGGTRDVAVQAFGDWAPKAGTSGFFDPGMVDHQSFRGGLLVGGPLQRDTADFVFGIEAEHLMVPRPALWEGTADDSAIVAVARDSLDVMLADYLQPRAVDERRVSGFGRVNWRLSPRQLLTVWGNGGQFVLDQPGVGPAAAPGPEAGTRGTDIVGGVSLASELSPTATNELRVGFGTSKRETEAGDLPATFFGSGHSAGTDPSVPGRSSVTSVHLRDAVHGTAGLHELKVGVTVDLASYDQNYVFGSGGVFHFSDAASLEAGRGFYYGVSGTPFEARFAVPQFGGFLQDRWEVAPGFAFLLGLRYDVELLPVSKVTLEETWLARTGIANDSFPSSLGKWSSRVGFDWIAGKSQAWRIRGGVGLYYDRVDPALLGELITQAGHHTVQRGLGTVGPWPTLPAAAPASGTLLTLAGPAFQPPRSLKASFGIGARVGGGGAVELTGNVRHTDFLPRRHNLNRLAAQAAQDQYGRPLYATLVKDGSLLAADPSTSRRFSEFDLVSALDPDGFSNYWAITLRVAEPLSRFVKLYGSYTYSQTKDNWLSGRYGGPYAQLTPFPDSLNGQDWADGTSDLDIPHRVSGGLELAPFGTRALTLAAQYRWQSGAPFTPGFVNGVDANGDGSATNDPAFVDVGVIGSLTDWPCLQTQVGQFAKRNSCRDPGTGALDLRVGLSPFAVRGSPVELWAEATNLIEPEIAVRDHALFALDPAAPLAVDSGTGRVTVPVVSNPNFGNRLSLATPGRVFRVGVRVNY